MTSPSIVIVVVVTIIISYYHKNHHLFSVGSILKHYSLANVMERSIGTVIPFVCLSLTGIIIIIIIIIDL